jgi:hypothetical protein
MVLYDFHDNQLLLSRLREPNRLCNESGCEVGIELLNVTYRSLSLGVRL